MYFILNSEPGAKTHQCPYCRRAMIKRLDKTEFYNKCQCWNKDCENKSKPFIILNQSLQDEGHLELYCEHCQEMLIRESEFCDSGYHLIFKCDGKLCPASLEPFRYDLQEGVWLGTAPRIIYEDDEQLSIDSEAIELNNNKKIQKREQTLKPQIEKTVEPTISNKRTTEICKIGENPLLSMSHEQYEKFLRHHENKAVILVDVPNFIRTLRDFYPQNFEKVLVKAHELLLQFIESYFPIENSHVIHYYAKPDSDLEKSNILLMDHCRNSPESEFFHLLKIPKSGHFSDIDNYLIANAIEFIERCSLKGLVIVSSDKDYLPVMRIASFRKVKSYILGVNTPEIYQEYDIGDIKFLGILNFFK